MLSWKFVSNSPKLIQRDDRSKDGFVCPLFFSPATTITNEEKKFKIKKVRKGSKEEDKEREKKRMTMYQKHQRVPLPPAVPTSIPHDPFSP